MAIHVAANSCVDPRAQIDDNVEIGPFCMVGPHARIGGGTRLLSHVAIMGKVTMGRYNTVYPNVVIGG